MSDAQNPVTRSWKQQQADAAKAMPHGTVRFIESGRIADWRDDIRGWMVTGSERAWGDPAELVQKYGEYTVLHPAPVAVPPSKPEVWRSMGYWDSQPLEKHPDAPHFCSYVHRPTEQVTLDPFPWWCEECGDRFRNSSATHGMTLEPRFCYSQNPADYSPKDTNNDR